MQVVAILGTHAFLEFHFLGLCWHTVLGFGCSRSFTLWHGAVYYEVTAAKTSYHHAKSKAKTPMET